MVFLALALISTASLGAAEEASLSANGIVERHAFSPLGTPKYGADFAHFDYVNPTAPKGGRISIGNGGRFDSLNPFILKGLPANPVTLTYDRLMVPSLDEAGVLYGLVAESVAYPEDFAWITFKLRPQARWHDGEPVTAEDVVFSFTALRADGLPIYRFGFGDVAKVEALDTHRVRFTIARRGNRQLVAQLAEMPVLPKHYWQGTDESGKPRDLGETTLEPPLTSGPYRVGEVKHGRTVELVRVPDYWGRDLPVNVGSHNLDRILYDYMQDQGIAREAFKAGEFDVWTENHSMHWAIGFDLPAVREGRMKRLASPNANPTPVGGIVFNTRRSKFSDIRVRRALNYAYDFKWLNINVYHGIYTRLESYFTNPALASSGVPTGRELELLQPYRDALPPELFTQAFRYPETDGSGNIRDNLRTAVLLLREAGWEVKDDVLRHKDTGEPFTIEFMITSQPMERVMGPFAQWLKPLGIQSSIRLVDPSQFANRVMKFDFDAILGSWPQPLVPGNEQREYWSSGAADRVASRNLPGVKSEVVDALVEKVIFAADRQELLAATHALDRVLLWNYYVVPGWYAAHFRVLYWNKFAFHEPLPAYGTGLPQLWWSTEVTATMASPNRPPPNKAQ